MSHPDRNTWLHIIVRASAVPRPSSLYLDVFACSSSPSDSQPMPCHAMPCYAYTYADADAHTYFSLLNCAYFCFLYVCAVGILFRFQQL